MMKDDGNYCLHDLNKDTSGNSDAFIGIVDNDDEDIDRGH